MVVVGLRSVRLRIPRVKFGYGGHGHRSVFGLSGRIGEEEATSREPAPVLDTTLQSPKLARYEHSGVLSL